MEPSFLLCPFLTILESGPESLTPTHFFFSCEADAQCLGSSGGDLGLPIGNVGWRVPLPLFTLFL